MGGDGHEHTAGHRFVRTTSAPAELPLLVSVQLTFTRGEPPLSDTACLRSEYTQDWYPSPCPNGHAGLILCAENQRYPT